ncbi:MAG: ferrous iron transport protein B [Tenericutes bacterium GWC2_34_14]|nr:MAG: ferrous iron transport protein B [Tenericutes bacterium GWC2_34_14]OHE34991.1 MAG: ferrous iron transport protein B [Tenericutes bacterium GWE2_34_108]OHE37149.1 MAG: ferrous iron transport protein B [Tenericutes bacterium GWF1_35_14]OHE39719.1 MAG: ferrous iron transport protein B [Tenericutes bacterium GWF2_35_184]OHE44093.1 MAG: ferrous iron transport protein B [Tenericutes bacterium RIFOXYA2_FULL_36_32]OHE44657.1 MAG: ferrous iron transport protein B [Tenericutes bacterium RIFOXYA1
MRIALVGNQNSGKTTLFNLLTGTNQKVGNWPGVTVERKIGIIRGTDFEIIDLPGIYSLSPYSVEENISRRFLFEEQVDLILNVIDATSVERSLYLTTQLLELKVPVIIALNMMDIADKRGIKFDLETLEKRLDTTILPISALKKTNVFNLIQTIKIGDYRRNLYQHIYDHELEEAIKRIEPLVETKHARFLAVKVIERDVLFQSYVTDAIEKIVSELEKKYLRDMEQVIADERYRYIEMVRDEAVEAKKDLLTTTDKLDNIFLNRYLAIPIFMLIMFGVYYLAAGPVGGWTVEVVDGLIGGLGEWMNSFLVNVGASPWAVSLVVDGMIAGVGAMMNFLPQLIILFILISLLETTGYMARIAFFLDRIFQKVGLSGKSLIPFIVGSGCSVPAIMSARTINDETEKKMTIMLTPFIPCSAKLPIITLFAGYFFGDRSGLVSASLYFFAIIIILSSAYVMKHVLFKGKTSSFILELPEYKLPSFRYIAYDVLTKAWSFIERAGSVILLASIVVWFLISFNFKLQYGVDIDSSMLAFFGKILSYVFYPMLGELSWAASVSAIQGLVAKEQVVGSMAIIAGYTSDVGEGNLIFNSGIFGFFTASSAYAFMVFNLFSAPCFGAIGAMRQELGTTKRMWKAVLFQTGLAWILAVLVFNIGRLIEVIL